MSQSYDSLSTSALARELGLPLQQLFSTLRDYGWIRKIEDGWALTGKGEFEGGRYINSKRYGRYIVWPKTLLEHPLLQALEHVQMLSSAALGRHFGVTPRQINRLLVALGLMRSSRQGWSATPLGHHCGAQLVHSQDSGMNHLIWPEALVENPALERLVAACKPPESVDTTVAEDDLFSAVVTEYRGLDGHCYHSAGRWQVAQWLYLAGLRYAVCHPLPVEESSEADFYLPDFSVFIELWGGEDHPDALAARLTRQDLYHRHQLEVVDIHADELPQLDDVLSRRLQDLGVDFY
jgi:hypothetical protein